MIFRGTIYGFVGPKGAYITKSQKETLEEKEIILPSHPNQLLSLAYVHSR